MNASKQEFLRNTLVGLLKTVPSSTPPSFGKMSFQQMVEHFADAVRMASGRLLIKNILTPEDQLQKMRDFMMSDKPFRENTPNPLLPEMPAPVKSPTVEAAIDDLQKEIDYFFTVFEDNDLQTTRNPFFGDLSFEQNVQLLHKHALHHLKQFGVSVEQN